MGKMEIIDRADKRGMIGKHVVVDAHSRKRSILERKFAIILCLANGELVLRNWLITKVNTNSESIAPVLRDLEDANIIETKQVITAKAKSTRYRQPKIHTAYMLTRKGEETGELIKHLSKMVSTIDLEPDL